VKSPWQGVLETPGAAGGKPAAASRSLGEVFEEVGGSLLILGEPGAGKTVTLLGLARHLLRSAEEDSTRPIPVVFNLSSWAAAAEPLADWLVDELAAKYLIPKKVGRTWLGESHLLPLLDGLDEVQAVRRAACVEAINAFTEQAILTGVVVCCRLKEYLELPVRLGLNGAVRLQPLSREQVFAFVTAAGPRLAALRSLLERDSGLLIEARSPLMLSLMAEAYEDLPVEALETESQETTGARRKKLMEAYVARMFRRAEVGGARG
jgi:predicted NACHT family NTPase